MIGGLLVARLEGMGGGRSIILLLEARLGIIAEQLVEEILGLVGCDAVMRARAGGRHHLPNPRCGPRH